MAVGTRLCQTTATQVVALAWFIRKGKKSKNQLFIYQGQGCVRQQQLRLLHLRGSLKKKGVGGEGEKKN